MTDKLTKQSPSMIPDGTGPVSDQVRRQVLSQMRIKVAFVVVTLALLAAFAATMVVSVDRIFGWLTPVARRDLYWKAQRGVAELSRTVDLGILVGDEAIVKRFTRGYEGDSEVRLLEIRNRHGEVVYRHDKGGVPKDLVFTQPQGEVVEKSGHLWSWAPVQIEGERLGGVALAISTARLQAGVNLRYDILRVAVGACIVGVILSLLFVSLYVGPLVSMTKRAFLDLERKTVEALEASRVKSEFLANMSHEIRTPLNGVIGMLGLMVRGELSARQQRRAEISESSARSLLALINDILDFSKLEAGQHVLHQSVCDLHTLVRNRIELLAVKAHAKQLEIAYQFAPDVPQHVLVDGDRLTQIITNLVGNAVKFTLAGEVAVTVQREHKAPATEDIAQLRFEVRDTGPGISAADQQRLFKSFSQVDGSATRAHEGTGLGLAISKHLITLMGGEIGLNSTPGVGSTFWFSVPCKVAPQERKADTRSGSSQARHVLIAEPNSMYRQVLADYANSWGMQVQLADSSSAALSLARTAQASGQPFELAVIDLRMQDEQGNTLAHALKELCGSGLSLIQLTPALWTPSEREAAEAGAFLAKPVRASDLYDCIVTRTRPGTGGTRQRALALGARAGHILVVDDNEVNRVLADELLRELQHTCDLAEGGREAIECSASRVYDAILMDCQMPGTNGYQATFEIRAREGSGARRTPIIALTAHAFTGELQRVKAAGMDDMLTKPVTPELLDATLQKWMAIASTGRVRSLKSVVVSAAAEPVQLPAAVPANDTTAPAASDGDPAAGQPVLVEQRRSVRLLQTFARTVPALAESLVLAGRAGDLPTLRGHAHKLKGSAGSVGAMRLSKLCEAIQHAADRGDHAPLAAWTELVVEALAEVSQLLDAELQSKQAQQA